MSERKLVSIRKISHITPIEGADRIEVAHVDGWQCVIAKDYHMKPEDKIVFFEVDSVLPISDARYDFMDRKKLRIKTIKLRKTLSQGLVMPIDMFEDELGKDPALGLDVTEALNVVKYELPRNGRQGTTGSVGKLKGLSEGVIKTGANRIQNHTYAELKPFLGSGVTITEKIDGQSTTFAYDPHKDWIEVMSHNVTIGYLMYNGEVVKANDKFTYRYPTKFKQWCKPKTWKKLYKAYSRYRKDFKDVSSILTRPQMVAAIKYQQELLNLFECNTSYVVQGEVFGKGITGHNENHYKIDYVEFMVFKLTDRTGRPIPTNLVEYVGLKSVPTIGTTTLGEFFGEDLDENQRIDYIKLIDRHTKGVKSTINNKAIIEGIVIEIADKHSKIKVISNEFLLKDKG